MPFPLKTKSSTVVPFTLTRQSVLMTGDPANPHEAEGVLNPATAWDADGNLFLYPRLVAEGNISRIGRAKVTMTNGVPSAVVRDGVALSPDRGWEHGSNHGGVEDARITWIPSLATNVMSYVAFGPTGPRPALAISSDGVTWTRIGPIQFEYDDELDTDLNLFPNKDVVFFPEVVPSPDGTPSYALLHRPMWDFSFLRPKEKAPLPAGVTDSRASIWISYIPAVLAQASLSALTRPSGHRQLAGPKYEWESIKIGAGPAPIRVDEGWLLIHHGVSGQMNGSAFSLQEKVQYAAGGMILDPADPSRVLSRSARPLLSPETSDETDGIVANVVFPTAIEKIEGKYFVFYGMADSKIGVARLNHN